MIPSAQSTTTNSDSLMKIAARDCETLKHHGHKCLSLADAASKYRQEMDELSNKAIDLAEEVKAGEACLKEATDDLKQEYANTVVLIKSTFKEVRIFCASFLKLFVLLFV